MGFISERGLLQVMTGLEIIFGHSPVKMTSQIHFSSDIPRFWPDKYDM